MRISQIKQSQPSQQLDSAAVYHPKFISKHLASGADDKVLIQFDGGAEWE